MLEGPESKYFRMKILCTRLKEMIFKKCKCLKRINQIQIRIKKHKQFQEMLHLHIQIRNLKQTKRIYLQSMISVINLLNRISNLWDLPTTMTLTKTLDKLSRLTMILLMMRLLDLMKWMMITTNSIMETVQLDKKKQTNYRSKKSKQNLKKLNRHSKMIYCKMSC